MCNYALQTSMTTKTAAITRMVRLSSCATLGTAGWRCPRVLPFPPTPQPPQNDVFGSATSKNIILGWLGSTLGHRQPAVPVYAQKE